MDSRIRFSISPAAILWSCKLHSFLREPSSVPQIGVVALPGKSKTGKSCLFSAFHKHLSCPHALVTLISGEWRGGVSPPRSLRTGREPLGSSGSQYPAVGSVVQRLCLGHAAPPVTGWPPALGGIPQPLRSSSITEPSSLLRTAPSLCPASVLLPSRGSLMVKKLIFASKEGKFPRPKAHAVSRS